MGGNEGTVWLIALKTGVLEVGTGHTGHSQPLTPLHTLPVSLFLPLSCTYEYVYEGFLKPPKIQGFSFLFSLTCAK